MRPPSKINCPSDADSPWRPLNDAALASLGAWVDALKLYNCIRKHDGSYAAVATWRPSSSGRATEQRKRNLGISAKGIKDFGMTYLNTDYGKGLADSIAAAFTADGAGVLISNGRDC